MTSNGLFHYVAGKSCEGRDLVLQTNFDPRGNAPEGVTLVLGGTHGDEPASYELVQEFSERLLAHGKAEGPIIAWPLLNPDALLRNSRYNARGVDLNRNCGAGWSTDCEEPPGPGPWSEPENCALRDVILAWKPMKIVTLHWALAELDADGQHSVPLRDAMWDAMAPNERLPYRKALSTSPAFPGSLGHWCGFELRYANGRTPAIVTLELPTEPEKPRPAELPPNHFAAMLERWRIDSRGYMDLVRPGVMKMLLAACTCRA
jgi:murein peptide amidase A